MLSNLPRTTHKLQFAALSSAIAFIFLLLIIYISNSLHLWSFGNLHFLSTINNGNHYATVAWKFDSLRDGFNHGLSDRQCEEAFPEYYEEINRAALFWKGKKISQAEMSMTNRQSAVRAMIYDRQLYIMESHMINAPGIFDLSRTMAVLGSLNRAIDAHQGPLPDIEFVFTVHDIERNPAPAWTLCRAPENETHWVMPDFSYWSWDNTFIGSYQQFLTELKEKPIRFSDKKQQVFWRGSDTDEERHNLLDATRGQQWADIEPVTWGKDPLVPIVDHCNYQYLVQTEGMLSQNLLCLSLIMTLHCLESL